MSRNFELLQRAQQSERFFELEEEASSLSATVAAVHPFRSDLSGHAEQEVTRLVQRVFLLPGPKGPHTVVFAGVTSGSGSTWMVMNAGRALASQIAGSVCLVDANLRSPALHRHFGIDNHNGLADAIASTESIRHFVQKVGDNLYLLSCGSNMTNSQALASSAAMRNRISDMQSHFEYVLIDSAPLNLYTDTVMLGRLADGVVIVLEANNTRREIARKAIDHLGAAQVKLLGAVLNKRTYPIPNKFYNKF